MKKFTHIFFDLDHTLWDYDTNARKVLHDLYQEFKLNDAVTFDADGFTNIFFETNDRLWSLYNKGEVEREMLREKRFGIVLDKCGCQQPMDHKGMNEYFLYNCPRQTATMEDAVMILDYLSKRYQMSIITNGFDDVQEVKLKSARLDKYFSHVFTSETIGFKKPSREIFDYALQQVGADRNNSLMIGDNPFTDILGANNAEITPVLYNPTGKVKSECQLQINHLSELLRIL